MLHVLARIFAFGVAWAFIIGLVLTIVFLIIMTFRLFEKKEDES